jgi:F0F1-type ATP synthase assembly protein I
MRRVPTDPSSNDPQPRAHQEGRRQAVAYQGAIEAVASIGIGGGLGYFADDHFDTSPILLLLGFVVGFGAFFVRLARLRRTLESIEKSPDRTE